MWCFPRFDLQICFAPQRRAILEHRNVQNGSGIVVFCAFWLANMLRATAACHFWTSERPKWGSWCFVHFDLQMCFAPQRRGILEHRNFKKCYGNVSFLPFSLANVLFATAASHFSPVRGTATSAKAALASLLFEHQEPRFIEKTQRFATSLTFFGTFFLVTLHAGGSPFCWLDISTLLDTSTLLFNSAYSRKLDF